MPNIVISIIVLITIMAGSVAHAGRGHNIGPPPRGVRESPIPSPKKHAPLAENKRPQKSSKTKPPKKRIATGVVGSSCAVTRSGQGSPNLEKVIAAIGQVESGNNDKAVGDFRNGKPTAFGRYQIRPMWHPLTIRQCQDPATATEYLRAWLQQGPLWEQVRRWNGSGFKARAYVRKVQEVYNGL